MEQIKKDYEEMEIAMPDGMIFNDKQIWINEMIIRKNLDKKNN